jgi:predicted membrane chloride channel (bestrophin family)
MDISFILGIVFGLLLGFKINKTFLRYMEIKYNKDKNEK